MKRKTVQSITWGMALIGLLIGSCAKDKPDDSVIPDDDPSTRIETYHMWSDASYQSRASVIRYNNAFYAAFREPTADSAPKGGRVRVVRSTDGEKWETVKVFEFLDVPGRPTEPTEQVSFNGVNQYMKIPHHEDFEFTLDDVFSLSAWVYRDVGSPAAALVSTRSANNQNAFDLDASNNNLILDFGNPHVRRHNVPAMPFLLGQWNHVGFSYDGPNRKVWLFNNGSSVELSSSGQSNDLLGSEWNNFGNDISVFAKATLKTAASQVPTLRFSRGMLRTLRFWNKAMSEAEMAADMNAVVGPNTPDLIAGYSFSSTNLTWEDGNLVVPDVKGKHTGYLYNIDFVGTPKADLDAPVLSLAPGNRLMLTVYGEYDLSDGSQSSRRPFVAFSENGDDFVEMERTTIYYPDPDILSNGNFRMSQFTWDQSGSAAYGFNSSNALTLFKTTDGKTYRAHAQLSQLPEKASEVAVRFDSQNKLYALMKLEGSDNRGVLAVSGPPYTDFVVHHLDFPVQNANFAFLNDQRIIMVPATQHQDDTLTFHTVVVDPTGNKQAEKFIPILQENAYPGGLLVHDGYLWASFSAAPALNRESKVFLAKIPVDDIN